MEKRVITRYETFKFALSQFFLYDIFLRLKHMSHIIFDVPEGFVNPVSSLWTLEDNALVLQIGTDAVAALKRRTAMDHGDVLIETVRCAVDKLRSERERDLEKELRELQEKHRAERSQLDVLQLSRAATEAEHRVALHKASDEARIEAREDSSRRIAHLEVDLTRSREREEHTRAEMKNERRDASEKLEEIQGRLEDTLRKSSTSNAKGKGGEREHRALLEEAGLFVVDTTEGLHKGHFHDALIAEMPLHSGGELAVPTYFADGEGGGIRLSWESKYYRTNTSGIRAEVANFVHTRRRMLERRSAECFVFAATRPIPCGPVNNRRTHIEISRLVDDERLVVTGYIGAADLSAEEVRMMALTVLTLQGALSRLTRRLPLENEVLCELGTVSREALESTQAALTVVTGMCETCNHLRQQAQQLRLEILSNALHQYAGLRSSGLLERSDTNAALDDALESLASGVKKNARTRDKLITNIKEREALRERLAKRLRET